MIALQLWTGERILVNPANVDCVKEVRDDSGTYLSHVYVGSCVLKVRQTFEEIAERLGGDCVALPVRMNEVKEVSRAASSSTNANPNRQNQIFRLGHKEEGTAGA